jgi:hypothetical protein
VTATTPWPLIAFAWMLSLTLSMASPRELLRRDPLFRRLDAVVAGAEIRGATCYLDFPDAESEDGRFAESFCDVRGGAAAIRLQRQRFVGDPLAATILLAHEFGHALSWDKGYATELAAELNTRARAGGGLSEHEALVVLDEECRAWLYAERELASIRFPHATDFQRLKACSLASYCSGFGLDEGHWKQREHVCELPFKKQTGDD